MLDAPRELHDGLQSSVGLVRWQSFEDMTMPLFDMLAREAVDEAKDVAAAAGFFSPQVSVTVDARAQPARVSLQVVPGEPTRIRSVRIDVEGEAAGDERARAVVERVRAQWRLPAGEVFTQSRWTAAKDAAVNEVARNGFAAAAIHASEASIVPGEHAADLSIAIDSGPRFRFGEIRIRGLERYPEALVRNYATFRPGDDFDADTLDQFVRRLNGSGYFASVQALIDTTAGTAGSAPVDVAVIEAPTRHLDTGIGYSTDRSFRFNLSWRDVDVDDKGRQLNVDMRLESIEKSIGVRLTAPPTAGGWIDSVFGSFDRTDVENLVTETGVIGIRRQALEERDNWAFGAAYYIDQQRPLDADESNAHALYLEAVRIWRRTDVLAAPTRGFNVALTGGGGVPGVSSRGFGRVIGQFASWTPLPYDLSVTTRAEMGAVIADSREGVPSALLFRTGGDTTVRGYAYESLGVREGSAIVPGRYYALASAELTRWFSPFWGLAVFADAGNAVDKVGDLSHLALGYGVGGRFNTPIGPFKLDLAYGQDAHSLRLHFSVGLTF